MRRIPDRHRLGLRGEGVGLGRVHVQRAELVPLGGQPAGQHAAQAGFGRTGGELRPAAVAAHVVDADDVCLEQGGDARAVPELLLQLVALLGEVADAGRGLDDPVLQQRDPGLFAARHDVDGEPERALEKFLAGTGRQPVRLPAAATMQHRAGGGAGLTLHHASPVLLVDPGVYGSARRFSGPPRRP